MKKRESNQDKEMTWGGTVGGPFVLILFVFLAPFLLVSTCVHFLLFVNVRAHPLSV